MDTRPRVRAGLAVVRRAPGVVQVGIDPKHAVVIDSLPEALVDELIALDGRHTVAELGERLKSRGEDPTQLGEVLSSLEEAGLLDDGPLARGGTAAVHGSGHLALSITSLLVESSVQLAHNADLTVLAATLVPDPNLVGTLMAFRTPHLAVRVREGVGIVGPLVLPGRSSCLNCADLHRTDQDPAWPVIAAQLVGRPASTDVLFASGTAALAVAQVLGSLSYVRGHDQVPPPVVNATLELDLLSGVAERRSWYPHPDCQCSAHNMAE
ncbi:TOMM precursor leader peptide-binding protein [Lentzea sp. BCCO 10_0798]|uniref:TOMM leader peptide-binding protein n=1 Tax=Lentzea kristufekii TaxID=3095430 RepID=A0ABU4TY53_9PSEU|nr:TOMM precursor leader peptide-binding protein [Lentzea sp. BCCO 10_0798]MDX8052741.1 TOMM precursor leader peptide-binding protein [Lentzea sp. BCCO 10_0798]